MIPQRFTYYIPLPVLLLLHSLAATGQSVAFTLEAEAQKMGLNDQIQVQYTIRDVQELKTIGNETIKDFRIVGGPFQSQSSNMSITGNRVVQTTSLSFSYILQPLHTGTLTVPAGFAKDQAGHSYQSNTLTIQVVPGSLAQRRPQQQAYDPWGDDPYASNPAAAAQRRIMQAQQQQQQRQQAAQAAQSSREEIGKNLFIKVNVDKQQVHVGEQITASYKLYARIPMQVGISKLPSLNGFWTQDFDIPKQPKPEEEIVDGKKYQVFLLKKSALFPQQAGKLILDPAEAQGTARLISQTRQRNPFADMFDDPFFKQAMGGSFNMADPFADMFNSVEYQDIPVHLKSQPVAINVTALPDRNVPEAFGGAVGSFTINARLDKTRLTTDDAATLQLTIAGSGNLKLIQAPALSLPNGLDTYTPQVTDTITGRSTTISGAKIITYSITPRTPGDYDIAPIAFTYYNTQTGQYSTLHTAPFKLQVSPGKHYNPAVAKLNPALKDIHGNAIQVPSSFSPLRSSPLPFRPGYWSLYALPLLGFIGIVYWKRRDEALHSDLARMRNKQANKVALKRMNTARQLLQQQQHRAFYEEVSKAIWLYLSDKLGIPLSALSRETVNERLSARSIPQALQEATEQVARDCELALYAPAGGQQQMQQTYEQAVSIISKLEGYLQR